MLSAYQFGVFVKHAVNNMPARLTVQQQPTPTPTAPKPIALNYNARKQMAQFQNAPNRPKWDNTKDTEYARGLLQQHYPKRYPNAAQMSPQDVYNATLNEGMVRGQHRMASRGGAAFQPSKPTPFQASMNAGRPNWQKTIPVFTP